MIDQVICGDCIEVLKDPQLQNAVDLTVTSPPYDALRTYGIPSSKPNPFNFPAIAEALWQVTKPGGVVVWVVGDETIKGSESGSSFRQALHFMDLGFKLFDTMIFEKTGTSFPSQGRYVQIFEYMFVFSKGLPKTFNGIKDVDKLWEGSWGKSMTRQKDGSLKGMGSKTDGKAKSGRATDGRYGKKLRTNIWKITNGKKFGHTDELAYQHPATFPEALARDHILTWTNPGDLVLDPMCGAGTVAKECVRLKRHYLAIDIDDAYCKLSLERLALVTPNPVTQK